MSFFNTKKNKSRTIGLVFAAFITGFMTLGFLQSYQQTKLRQVKKVDLVEVAIFADNKPAAEPILYEVVPTEECIKQLTVHGSQSTLTLASTTSAVAQQASSAALGAIATEPAAPVVTMSSLPNAHAAEPATSINSASPAKVATAIPMVKKPAAREPILVPATAPKCIARSIIPSGHEKLGSEGFIGLALNLAKTGRIERGEIEISSGFPELDIAALKQVSEGWQFEPCKKQNKIVACKQHIRIRWQVI